MLGGLGTAQGVYFRIKNNTSHSVDNLYYSHGSSSKQKVGKINKGDHKQLLIVNSSIFQDEDLIIEDGTGKQFIFEKMVKKFNGEGANYHYNFLKIEDGDEGIKFEDDGDGRKKFFEYV